jgi:hypothetical protein
MTAVASLVPIVGTAIVWVPAAGLLAITGSVGAGLGLAAWCLVAVVGVEHVAKPFILSRTMGHEFHPGLMLLALPFDREADEVPLSFKYKGLGLPEYARKRSIPINDGVISDRLDLLMKWQLKERRAKQDITRIFEGLMNGEIKRSELENALVFLQGNLEKLRNECGLNEAYYAAVFGHLGLKLPAFASALRNKYREHADNSVWMKELLAELLAGIRIVGSRQRTLLKSHSRIFHEGLRESDVQERPVFIDHPWIAQNITLLDYLSHEATVRNGTFDDEDVSTIEVRNGIVSARVTADSVNKQELPRITSDLLDYFRSIVTAKLELMNARDVRARDYTNALLAALSGNRDLDPDIARSIMETIVKKIETAENRTLQQTVYGLYEFIHNAKTLDTTVITPILNAMAGRINDTIPEYLAEQDKDVLTDILSYIAGGVIEAAAKTERLDSKTINTVADAIHKKLKGDVSSVSVIFGLAQGLQHVESLSPEVTASLLKVLPAKLHYARDYYQYQNYLAESISGIIEKTPAFRAEDTEDIERALSALAGELEYYHTTTLEYLARGIVTGMSRSDPRNSTGILEKVKSSLETLEERSVTAQKELSGTREMLSAAQKEGDFASVNKIQDRMREMERTAGDLDKDIQHFLRSLKEGIAQSNEEDLLAQEIGKIVARRQYREPVFGLRGFSGLWAGIKRYGEQERNVFTIRSLPENNKEKSDLRYIHNTFSRRFDRPPSTDENA